MLMKSLPATTVVVFAALFVFVVDSQPASGGDAARPLPGTGAAPAPAAPPAAPGAPDVPGTDVQAPSPKIPGHYFPCENCTVHKKIFGEYTACCGEDLVYNSKTHMCCDGVVVPYYPSHTCCGKVAYDYTMYVCCYPSLTIIYKEYGDRTACCGCPPIAYDYATQQCCNETLIDPKKELCCNGEVVVSIPQNLINVKTLDCCGKRNIVYDWTKFLCCDGVVQPKIFGDYSGCCGNRVIDWRTQSCCYNYTCDAQGNYQLVSMTPFNTATHFCCNGAVLPKTFGAWSWCCGGTVYNYSSSLCCNNTVVSTKPYGEYSYCCGSQVVSWLTTGCCYDRDCDHEQRRCYDYWYYQQGTATPYDYKSEICCDGSIKDKVFGDESGCCETVVYNTTCNVCCCGVLHCKPPNDNVGCCGYQLYDWRREICCCDWWWWWRGEGDPAPRIGVSGP